MPAKRSTFLTIALFSITLIQSLSITSCKFFQDFFADGEIQAEINDLSFDRKNITVAVGGIEFLNYRVSPSNAKIEPSWEYDSTIISCDKGVIKGLKEGETSIRISYGNFYSVCLVTVKGYSDNYLRNQDPYIYSDYQIEQMSVGESKQINVSLYNGTATDINGYTWEVDNPAVITVNQNGQYANIKALANGYARIKVTHTKATYPYYIGIYVLEDINQTPFITTKEPIKTLNKADGEKSITVWLKNAKQENYAQFFQWDLTSGDNDCISISGNHDTCVITPLKKGECTLRATHPDAIYPLDITVRVIEIIENVYIDVPSVVNIVGEQEIKVEAILKGLENGKTYSQDEFEWEIENEELCSYYSYGNEIALKGLKNGSTHLYVSHPLSEKRREILVITKGQLSDAIDSSCFITTTQDFIKTKVGAGPTMINIMLKGGKPEDSANFKWSIKSVASDGSSDDVISVITANGTVENSRAALNTYASGVAEITPLKEGTATITLSNPKSYYTTEVLVKVLSKDAILEEPLYFGSSGIIRFLNSESYDFNIELLGDKKKLSDEESIHFEVDNAGIFLNSQGNKCVLNSSLTGSNVSTLTITHPKVLTPKKILVLTADTQEELKAMKAFFSDKTYYSVNKNKTCTLIVDQVGFENEDGSPYDFSLISWTSNNPQVATVEKGNDPLCGVVTANSVGSCKITANYQNLASITFDVTVYPENIEIGQIEKSIYLSTTQNVIIMNSLNSIKLVSVSPIGLNTSDYKDIVWESLNEDVCSVIGNGASATLTSLKEGEALLQVSHPKSENVLKIHVRIGTEYVIPDTVVKYIAANTDTVTLLADSPEFLLTCYLVNGSAEENQAGYSFEIDNSGVSEGVAEIVNQLATGKCFIKPKKPGQTEITITHPASSLSKKILIVVGNSKEELSAFKFLYSTRNVVFIGEGQTETVNISMENSPEILLSGYSWRSEDNSIASVVSESGALAIIKGNKIGVTKIKVTHEDCKYPFEMIVQVVDPVALAANPFIRVKPPLLTLKKSSTFTDVTAELVGGSEADSLNFTWTASDPSIIEAYGNQGVGRVRALKGGTAYLTASHPKAHYSQQILCVCDDTPETPCSIGLSCGNILSIKPSQGDMLITANLINGLDVDKPNFRWSLDIYDVIDIIPNGNTALIKPLKTGTCKIIISHPKSGYDQTIIVKVAEYAELSFDKKNLILQEGKVSYLSMRVPASSSQTHIVYRTDNERVVTLTGTNAICQITGVGVGTTQVHADLVETRTNTVQATTSLLVAVEKGDANQVYITTSNSYVTLERGMNKILNATIVGYEIDYGDQQNLMWKSSDPTIISLTGASTTGIVTGGQARINALKSGEVTLTVSHEKSNSDLTFYVIVPGEETKTIQLNKTFCTIEKNKGTELTATITSATQADYASIEWTSSRIDGEEIVRIMGNGKTVSVYGLKAGRTTVTAQLPNGNKATCDVEVESTKSITFKINSLKVMPGETKIVEFTVSPASCDIQMLFMSEGIISVTEPSTNNGKGVIEITGIKEGRESITLLTEYGSKATLSVTCDWEYSFYIDKQKIMSTPDEEAIATFRVNPPNALIQVDESLIADTTVTNNGDGTGTIKIVPTKEGTEVINIRAVNPANNYTFGNKNLSMSFNYGEALEIVPKLISSDGNFSRVEDGILYIGDGENIEVDFTCKQEKANVKITDVRLDPTIQNQTLPEVLAVPGFQSRRTLSHPKDKITEGYMIPEWYDVYLSGSEIDAFACNWYLWSGVYDGPGSYANDWCGCQLVLYYGEQKLGEIDINENNGNSYKKYSIENYIYTRANPLKNGIWIERSKFENSYWHCPTVTCHGFDAHENEGPRTRDKRWIHEYPAFNKPYIMGKPVKTIEEKNTIILNVTYTRNGKTETVQLPIYEEIRMCNKDFK